MEKRQLFLVLTLLLSNLTAFAAVPDTLWQKSVDAFAQTLNWVPGTIVSHFEMTNGKGKTEEITESVKKLSSAADGSIHTERQEFIVNGEDKTEEVKNRVKDDGFSLTEAPLHPDNQGKITVTRLPDSKMINSVLCTGFDYTLDLEEQTKSGTLWMDSNGYPVQHEFTTTPLPPNVQKLETRAHYIHKQGGTFYLSEITYSGEGGMLFIKKFFQGKMTYSDYWQRTRY